MEWQAKDNARFSLTVSPHRWFLSPFATGGRTILVAVILPALILVVIRLNSRRELPLAEPAAPRTMEIEVTGQDFVWQFRIVEDSDVSDRNSLTSQRGILRLPARTEVQFRITSADYVYVFEIPDYCREAAVPGLVHEVTYTMPDEGVVELPTDPLCAFGPQHDKLMGRLRVEDTTGEQ